MDQETLRKTKSELMRSMRLRKGRDIIPLIDSLIESLPDLRERIEDGEGIGLGHSALWKMRELDEALMDYQNDTAERVKALLEEDE